MFSGLVMDLTLFTTTVGALALWVFIIQRDDDNVR